jgi:hypothetical protein
MIGAWVVLVPRAASADPSRDACFDAYEQAQRLRNDEHLRAARDRLATCAHAACPAFVRSDCAAWLGEVEAELAAAAARSAPEPAPAAPATPPAGATSADAPPAAPAPPWFLRLPTATYSLGGVAALGLASFAGFALAGASVQACAPGCSSAEVAALRRDYLVADVSLVGALAAAGGAIAFALASPPERSSVTPVAPRATSWWLGVRVEGLGPWVGAGAAF